MTLLVSPITNPKGCQQAVKLGQRCWGNCKYAMRAVGEQCYAVAIARGAADPSLVGSNTTVAFDQCTNNLAYTTLAEWTPSPAFLAAAGTSAPVPSASMETSPASDGMSPASGTPAATTTSAPGPSTSAALQITMAKVAAMLSLMAVALI